MNEEEGRKTLIEAHIRRENKKLGGFEEKYNGKRIRKNRLGWITLPRI